MPRPSNLSRPIIEALYSEALLLADEVRLVFAVGIDDLHPDTDDNVRLAMSAEGLRTTTRIMHILAWLLNQRAYFSGELSDTQLRRHGQLPEDRPSDANQIAMLEPATRDLIAETMQMHQRIARLDRAWRDGFEVKPAIRGMHERLGRAVEG